MQCDQCEMLSINGVPCHERGCPNMGATTPCNECDAAIPDSVESEVNRFHSDACSLHPDNSAD